MATVIGELLSHVRSNKGTLDPDGLVIMNDLLLAMVTHGVAVVISTSTEKALVNQHIGACLVQACLKCLQN